MKVELGGRPVPLVVLMPSCDWPRGSGMMNPNTPDAIRSVLRQSIPSLSLWIALDGKQPEIREFAESLADPRIQMFETEKTRSSGNHQRRQLMELLLRVGLPEGALFAFHDDDDAYLDGALQLMRDISVEKGSVPVLARHVRPLLDHITTDVALNYAAGNAWRFNMPISFAASVFPVMEGMPLWPTEGGYYADLPYARELLQWYEEHGKAAVLLEKTVTRLRPTDAMGSLVPEYH